MVPVVLPDSCWSSIVRLPAEQEVSQWTFQNRITNKTKKFISNSHFETSIFKKTSFEAPHNLEQSLIETIEYEFLEDNSNKQVFETE